VPTGSLLGGSLMYVPARVWLYAQLIFLMCGGVVANAGQTTQEASSPDALKERVLQYYRLAKGDRVAALALVAPESKNDFFNMSYDGVVEFRILNVDLSDGGDKATVKILRTDRFLRFPQLLDYETTETWKRIDGQWYILLPSFKEMETPFGKMRFSGGGEGPQTSKPEEMFRLRQGNVDPDQYLKGLQKVALEAKKKQEEEKKSAEKKPGDQAAPKPKPPLQPQN